MPRPALCPEQQGGLENPASRSLGAPHATLNSLSFVNNPYSSENHPVLSPAYNSIVNLPNPSFHQRVAVRHSSQQSPAADAYTFGLNVCRPARAISVDRSSGVEIGPSRGLPNANRNLYPDRLRHQRRLSLAPEGPYSLGIRSSRAGRTGALNV
jgi:hypothetical protein